PVVRSSQEYSNQIAISSIPAPAAAGTIHCGSRLRSTMLIESAMPARPKPAAMMAMNSSSMDAPDAVADRLTRIVVGPRNPGPVARKQCGPPPSPGAGRRVTTAGGSVVRGGRRRTAGDADVHDHVLDVLRYRSSHHHRYVVYEEVYDSTNRSKTQTI